MLPPSVQHLILRNIDATDKLMPDQLMSLQSLLLGPVNNSSESLYGQISDLRTVTSLKHLTLVGTNLSKGDLPFGLVGQLKGLTFRAEGQLARHDPLPPNVMQEYDLQVWTPVLLYHT